MVYADLHCDALTAKRQKAEKFYEREYGQVSLNGLVKGGCVLQVFALFSRSLYAGSWEKTLELVADYRAAEERIAEKGITPVLAIEDGGSVSNEIERVAFLLDAGVKIFGLTWNDGNCLGAPCGEAGGLTEFGRETVELLLERKVYPDLSHLSDRGTEEVLNMAKKAGVPAIATHSLSRSVCPHKRNLTDGQIRKIADVGGVIGVNFVPAFVGESGLAAHIRRMVDIGGEEVVAIGTDFDGVEAPVYPSASEMPRFFADMKRAGFSDGLLEKLAIGNARRLFP